MSSEVSQESNLTPCDARPKFYALSDESFARSLQDEEFTSVAERNRQHRHRVQSERSFVKEDEELASQLSSLGVQDAKELALQESVAAVEQDKELAALLQEREHSDSKRTKDERIARELQDAEYAEYMQQKEKKKLEHQQHEAERQRLLADQRTEHMLAKEQQQLTRERERQRLLGEAETRRLLESEQQAAAPAPVLSDEELARRMQQAEVKQYRQALQARAAQQQQQGQQPGQAGSSPLPATQPATVAMPGQAIQRGPVRQQSMPVMPLQPAGAEQEQRTASAGQSLPAQAMSAQAHIRTRAMSDHRSAANKPMPQQQPQQASPGQPVQTMPPPSAAVLAASTTSIEEEPAPLVPKMGKRRVKK